MGIIGGSINSAVGRTHIIASQLDNKWAIVSGCFSRNEKLSYDTAKEYGVDSKRIYTDWELFLETEKSLIDAVCILTPTNAHKAMILKALQLNIPIICEKALAMDYYEVIEIERMLKETNGFLAVTYNYTGYPMVRELRNLIEENVLGNLKQIQIEMPQEGFLRTDKNGNIIKPQEWRLKDGLISTISLDLGVHVHNMIYFLTKESPLNLISVENNYGHFDVADDVKVLVNYSSNLQANIWYSKSALGNRNGLKVRVFGSEASAEWYQMNPEELIINYKDGKREIIDRASYVNIANIERYNRFKAGHPAGFIEAFGNYYFDISISLTKYLNNEPYESDFVFGLKQSKEGLKLLQLAKKSAENRKWINFNEEIIK